MRWNNGFATGRRRPFVCACVAGLALSASMPRLHSSLAWINSSDIERLAQHAGLTNASVLGVERNGAGATVYLTVRPMHNGGHGATVVCVSPKAVVAEPVPGVQPVLADDRGLVAFVTNDTLVVVGRQTCRLTAASRFGFSPGGEFFFLFDFQQRAASGAGPPAESLEAVRDDLAAAVINGSAAIFESSNPAAPVLGLPQGFVPWSIFSQTNRVFVFGYKYHTTGRRGHLQQFGWGLVFDRRGATLTLDRQIDMTRYGHVLDLDPTGAEALVQYGNDLHQRCGLLDMNTGKFRRVGRPRGYGLFLEAGLVDFLNSLRKP